MLKELLPFFLVSMISCYLLVYFENLFSKFGVDKNFDIQKIHLGKSLRLGGMIIFLSFSLIFIFFNYKEDFSIVIILCLIPVFLVGLLEDLTLNVSVRYRLLGSILTSFLLVVFGGALLKHADIFWMNYLLSVPVISIIVTILGITVTANAWNFIDGLNGLSSGLGVLSLLSISYLSLKSGNIYMSEMLLCLSAMFLDFG